MNVAIFNYTGKAPNRGGPTGYLHNLYEGAANLNDFPELLFVRNLNTNDSSKKNSQEIAPSALRRILYFFKQGFSARKKIRRIVNNYDYIHTHSSEDVIYLHFFCGFRGKVVFTPHRPEPLFEEQRAKGDSPNGCIRHFYDFIESQSYRIADGFIFPSKGAMQIYKNFPGFNKNSMEKPIEYVFTGVKDKKITNSNSSYRKKYNIDEDTFLISYIGRHNYIKGYDRLVESFKELKEHRIHVMVAGAKSEIQEPDDDMWHELGYINDVQNLMNCVNAVAIPNRNTYFDLVIVEALSMGKIVISSNTGGNVDISEKTRGLVLFDNDSNSDFCRAVLSVKAMSREERKTLESENKKFYDHYCNLTAFSQNYLNALSALCHRIH